MVKVAAKSRPIPLHPASSKSSSLKATIRDQSGAGKTRIGELLSKEGHITSTQLEDALKYQKQHPERLGNILIKLGYIEEETIVNVLNRLYNYPVALKSDLNPDSKTLEMIPYETAKAFMAFPMKLDGDNLEVAMAEPTDSTAVERLQKEVRKGLSIYVSRETDIIDAYRTFYKIDDKEYESLIGTQEMENEEEALQITEVEDFGSLVSEAVGDVELSTAQEEDDTGGEFSAADAPIIKLVNGIMIKAVNDKVSDIHIEPFEHSLQVRYRLDGSLYKSMNLPLTIRNALTSRIKILAGLNIAERRIPQDGRIKMQLGNRHADSG
jgi:type IV pilus assembly protein PilB